MAGKVIKPTPSNRPPLWQIAMPGALLVLLTFIAYIPALHGQFIWDDDAHVTRSTALHTLGGLWRIWFEPGATQQYYPLTHSSFWIDYHLWKLNTLPYHVENILLHGINAFLVWRILTRLKVPGAWLGAALFALHPVCVESVAWISERKNTLSGLFFLLSLFAAIEFWLPTSTTARDKEESTKPQNTFGPWKFYGLALCLYICALWSKTATVGLPGAILVLVWWKRGRLQPKDGLLVLPFVATGLVLGLFTVSIEHKFILDAANADEWALSWPAKFIIAGHNLWFYLCKLLWPYPLVFIYPRWVIQTAQPLSYLPLAAAGVTFMALLWFSKRAWARATLAAAGYFVAVLFPALGFVNIFPFRYSFVADHFQYLAAIGPLALIAAGITLLLTRAPQKNTSLQPAITAALLAVCAVLTWRQAGIYRNLETLWTDTLAHNPQSWMAHDNLGLYLTEQQRFSEADEHFHKAIEIRPNDHIAYYDLGLKAAIQGDLDSATQNFNKTLELCPTFAMAHYQIGNLLARQRQWDDAIQEYKTALLSLPKLTLGHFNLANALAQTGKPDDAIAEYHYTLDTEPDYAPAYIGIARILTAQGHTDEAIVQYREALEVQPNAVEALVNLGNAMVSKNQFDDAIDYYRSALRVEPGSPLIHFDLSVALAKRGDTSEAEQERSEAMRLRAALSPGR